MIEFQNFFKANIKVIITCSLILAAVATTGIIAFLTDSAGAYNKMVIGENSIDLIEDFTPPKELAPGVSFKKNVKVKNVGSLECFVRIKSVFTDSDMGNYCEVDWNETDWAYDSADGYWYYKYALPSGKATTSLFTTIKLSKDTPEAAIKDFDMIVYAESYQSYGFADYAAAWANYKTNKPN